MRSNACLEITKFWLEARYGCLTQEALPVKVPYAHSDIDLIAIQPRDERLTLPTGARVGPRLIVETKDEHDWEPTGREFGTLLLQDVAKMQGMPWVPRGTKGIKFSMLREEHFERSVGVFGNNDFDRLFVVHAMSPEVLLNLQTMMAEHRIHWITIRDVVRDLAAWYRVHQHQTTLRHSPIGDLLHLLLGFCHDEILPASG